MAIADPPQARRVTGKVTRVDRANGHVSVRAEGREIEVRLTPAKARHVKRGDRIAVWLPGQPEARSPKWSKLRGDPGPPAAAIPPPAGYPVGPGMGPDRCRLSERRAGIAGRRRRRPLVRGDRPARAPRVDVASAGGFDAASWPPG